MRILCIGDPHIRLESLHLVQLMMDGIRDRVDELTPTVIVVLGDVLHTHERLHTTSLNYAVRFIDFLATIAPTYVLVGNHDLESNQCFLSERHWMNALKSRHNIHIVDKVTRVDSTEGNVLCVPYVPVGRFQEALDTVQAWKDADLILAHQEFRGCHMGAIVSHEGDAWSTQYPFVVSGHIHSNETLPEGVYYPGSSIQHAFGESNKNIIALVTLQEGRRIPHIQEIDLQLPRKVTIYKSVEDVKDVVIPQDQHQYKLVLKGNHDSYKTFQKSSEYKQLLKHCKVVFKPTIDSVEYNECKTSDNLFVTGFTETLQHQVYDMADNYLYCIFQKLIHGNEFREEDILVIIKDELQ